MDSTDARSKASLLQEDEHLRSIRKRNKKIIIGLFSLIITIALITSGFIVSFIQKNNIQTHQSLLQKRAIREFCYVTVQEFSCISSLSSAIKTTTYLNPNQIFRFSLEKSVTVLTDVVSVVSKNCSVSLRHSLDQIKSGLRVVRVNPDLETMSSEEKKDVAASIATATEDLRSCVNDFGENKSTTKVRNIHEWLRYSRDFLILCNMVNENFRLDLQKDTESRRNGLVEDLLTVSLFGMQYFVLLLLFCLLWRCYQ